MECPKCKEKMEVDMEKERYLCKCCGYVILWTGGYDYDK